MYMVSRVSLQDIINADWSKQYLDNNGEVKNKSCSYDFLGIGTKLVKLLRYVPFIGPALFPKPDITQASTAVKAKITELLKTGTSVDDAEVNEAALKVNGIVRKIIRTQDNPSKALYDALIFVKTDDLFDNEDDSEKVQPTTPNQVHDKADDKEEEFIPTTPTNTQSTPVDETPQEPARVEILPDDAQQTPVADKTPTNEDINVVHIELDDESSTTPPLLFDIIDIHDALVVEQRAEEVAVPSKEVIAKEKEVAEKVVEKETQKVSARLAQNKRKMQQKEEKAKAPEQAAEPKQQVAPKRAPAKKKYKHT